MRLTSILRIACFIIFLLPLCNIQAQGTRLLRQPSLSDTHVAFAYGGDIWVTERNGSQARRITSTAAVESEPHLSPDGQ